MDDSNHQLVLEAIEDRFFETGLFSNVKDIADWIGEQKGAVREELRDLEGGQVFRVYEGEGRPTIYITRQMKNSITSKVGEPDWMNEYEFTEKTDLREEVTEANEQIRRIQMIERLLFGSGPPLEESVEFALTEMGFHPSASADEEDFVIENADHTYVIEVKGVGGKIRKKHVTQLAGWIDLKLEDGIEPEHLTGILIHNHERHEDPANRGNPLSDHARRFLGIRQAKHVSTHEIYRMVKTMMENTESTTTGRLELEKARERFLSILSE